MKKKKVIVKKGRKQDPDQDQKVNQNPDQEASPSLDPDLDQGQEIRMTLKKVCLLSLNR